MSPASNAARRALDLLLREILDGPSPDAAFVLNRGDRGLFAALDALSAQAASARPGGRASVAAHVDHLRYGFQLLNRWAKGDDPWHDADYAASWRRQQVTGEEWSRLRTSLADEARAWARAVRGLPALDEEGWANVFSSVVHLAYHLGALRQIDAAAGGPPARD